MVFCAAEYDTVQLPSVIRRELPKVQSILVYHVQQPEDHGPPAEQTDGLIPQGRTAHLRKESENGFDGRLERFF